MVTDTQSSHVEQPFLCLGVGGNCLFAIVYYELTIPFSSIATDAKILAAVVVAYHMRFYPEKYIVSPCVCVCARAPAL